MGQNPNAYIDKPIWEGCMHVIPTSDILERKHYTVLKQIGVFQDQRGGRSEQTARLLRQWNNLVCYANAVIDIILLHFSKPGESTGPGLNAVLLGG